MRKNLYKLLIGISTIALVIVFLNVEVTTQQGIDYKVHTIKLPLYLKTLNFIDRHFNYKDLVKKIIQDERDEEKKVMKIFLWTHNNIKRQPPELPVIDDHVWHIIVRGYGVNDQSSDVFTTLCNYAGIDAFFNYIPTDDGKNDKLCLSFVKAGGGWTVFDPYHGAYFEDGNGNFAHIGSLKAKKFTPVYLGKEPNISYNRYFGNLPDITGVELNRSNIQSPLKRLIFWVKMLPR